MRARGTDADLEELEQTRIHRHIVGVTEKLCPLFLASIESCLPLQWKKRSEGSMLYSAHTKLPQGHIRLDDAF